MASGATCVQRLDGSRDSAIHTKYRISLRSSSMREPRYPLPRVVMTCVYRERAPAPAASPFPGRGDGPRSFLIVPWRVPRLGSFGRRRRLASSRTTPTGRGSEGRRPPRPLGESNVFAGRSALQVSTMILPQVHLRKPCYDFSFL